MYGISFLNLLMNVNTRGDRQWMKLEMYGILFYFWFNLFKTNQIIEQKLVQVKLNFYLINRFSIKLKYKSIKSGFKF